IAIALMLATPLADQANARRLTEPALRMFGRAGLGPAEAHRAFRVFQAFILGAALMIRARPTAAEVARQIRELDRSGEDLPLLRSALADRRILDRESDFEAGLELLLGAWRSRATRKRVTPRRGH
ncbi:MAG: TetR/AcrR family transcriptional regulator C-terminal domain-containing protein, partial [Gemmatimonadota bacterium]